VSLLDSANALPLHIGDAFKVIVKVIVNQVIVQVIIQLVGHIIV
jgi:hypothetical protein